MNTTKETKKIVFGIYGGVFASAYTSTFGIDLNYVNYFSKWGDVKMISTLEPWENQIDSIDVLVVPGGADVDPKRYGEKPATQTTNPNGMYEYLDTTFLNEWMVNRKRPVIAICRGLN